jgi:hypothetical protein
VNLYWNVPDNFNDYRFQKVDNVDLIIVIVDNVQYNISKMIHII